MQSDKNNDRAPNGQDATPVKHEEEKELSIKELAESLYEEAGGRNLIPAPGYAIRTSALTELVKESIKEFKKETKADSLMYHTDSDGLLSALANEDDYKDVPKMLGTKWLAARTEGEVITIDMTTPSCPGIDHKPSAEASDRHVIVPLRSMCEAFGKKGQKLSWATSDVLGRASPYDIIAIAEFIESTRGTFEDVLRDVHKGKLYSEGEMYAEIEDRIPLDDLPDPKIRMVKTRDEITFVIADYGVDEAVVLSPMCAVDIVLGKKYAYTGTPIQSYKHMGLMVERVHERKTIEKKIKIAEKIPVMIPTTGFVPPWG